MGTLQAKSISRDLHDVTVIRFLATRMIEQRILVSLIVMMMIIIIDLVMMMMMMMSHV